MSEWKLTVRQGPKVSREEYDRLEDVIVELRSRAEAVKAEGPLPARSMIRDFEPGDLVAARLEISGRGWLRSRTAGVDVKGDGAIVGFTGALRREELAPEGGETVFTAVRRVLERR